MTAYQSVSYASLTDADARALAEAEIKAFGFIATIQYIRYQWWPMIECNPERAFAMRVLAIVEREYSAHCNRRALLASIATKDADNKTAILASIARNR